MVEPIKQGVFSPRFKIEDMNIDYMFHFTNRQKIGIRVTILKRQFSHFGEKKTQGPLHSLENAI